MKKVKTPAPGNVTEEVAFFLDPTPGRIIVQEDQFKESSIIYTPETSKRRPTTGKILAANNVYDMLTVGTRVVYGLYSGTVINFKGQPAFRILGQDEVLSVVRGADVILEGVGV